MTNTDDLRYVRTEQAIRSAFMDLVSEMPVASVTASAICRNAGISRNAFYLHHASVSSLYATLVGEMVDDIRAESIAWVDKCASTGFDDEFYELMIASLARHEDLLRALLPSDDGSLAKCLAEGIENAFLEAALRFGKHGGNFEHQLRCAYSAWAVVGFASRWISETDRSLVEGLDNFRELLTSVIDSSARYFMKSNA